MSGLDEHVEIRAFDPHPSADIEGWQRPGVDPVADRLLIQLQDVGDLDDGQNSALGGAWALDREGRWRS